MISRRIVTLILGLLGSSVGLLVVAWIAIAIFLLLEVPPEPAFTPQAYVDTLLPVLPLILLLL